MHFFSSFPSTRGNSGYFFEFICSCTYRRQQSLVPFHGHKERIYSCSGDARQNRGTFWDVLSGTQVTKSRAPPGDAFAQSLSAA